MSTRLHALDVLGFDDDGTPYRHALTPHEPTGNELACVECHGTATVPHPRYPGVRLVEQCRGLTLCNRVACQFAHLERHMREGADNVPAKNRRRAA